MEIRRWLIYVVINCIIVTHLVAKPVSLNELIAAESKQKQTKQRTKPTGPKTVSLNELIAAESKETKSSSRETTKKPSTSKDRYPAESRQKLEKVRFPKILGKKPRRKSFSLKDLFPAETTAAKRRIESVLSRSPGIGLFSHRGSLFPALSRKPFESAESIFSFSPLKFRKKFEIKSPLKPKKIKYSFTPRHKRRNLSTKLEDKENEIFDHKYIPLIKRIGLLVGDILSPDSSESLEHSFHRRKLKRNKPKSTDNGKDQPDLESSESKPEETTVVAPTTAPPEISTYTEDTTSEAPDTTTYNTPISDVDTLRPDPNLPLSSARNSSSDRGDYHGVSERSGPAFYGDIEGYIARNNRSNEYYSRGERNQTYSSSYEENSSCATRINTCSDGSRDRTNPNDNGQTEKTKTTTSNGLVRRNDTHGKNIFQIGREQETLQVPRNVRRLPGPVSDKILIVDAESVPPEKSREKGFNSFTHNHTSAERRSEWYGPITTEDQRIRQVIEGVIPIQKLYNPDFLKQHEQQNQVVTIFDGYSVARDINGRNKLTEKSIRISPN